MSQTVEILGKEVKRLQNEAYNLEAKLELILNKKAYQILSEHIEDSITLRTTRDGIYFHSVQQEKSYSREIFTLNINRDWKTGKVTDVKPSCYSTSESTDYELRRLITIGSVAKFLLEGGKEEILGWWNSIIQSWSEGINKLNRERYTIESEIKVLEHAAMEEAKQKRLSLLKTKGLKFDYSELEGRHRMPTLSLKYEDYINNVLELKVTRESGKSVDIQVICSNQIFDEKIKEYKEVPGQPRIYERVKVANIESFLSNAQTYIVE